LLLGDQSGQLTRLVNIPAANCLDRAKEEPFAIPR
jgi:hypothetical protein